MKTGEKLSKQIIKALPHKYQKLYLILALRKMDNKIGKGFGGR